MEDVLNNLGDIEAEENKSEESFRQNEIKQPLLGKSKSDVVDLNASKSQKGQP